MDDSQGDLSPRYPDYSDAGRQIAGKPGELISPGLDSIHLRGI